MFLVKLTWSRCFLLGVARGGGEEDLAVLLRGLQYETRGQVWLWEPDAY